MIQPGSPTEGEMKLVLFYHGGKSGLETVWLNLSGVSAKPEAGAGEGDRVGGAQQGLLFVQSEDSRRMGCRHAPCRLDRSEAWIGRKFSS